MKTTKRDRFNCQPVDFTREEESVLLVNYRDDYSANRDAIALADILSSEAFTGDYRKFFKTKVP